MSETMVAAIFIDRDGTIIEDAHYPKDPKNVQWLANAVAGLKLFQQKGYLLFLVSNQSGVERGLITYPQFWSVHERFHQLCQQEQIEFEEYHYCFDSSDSPSLFRKPAPGMISGRWRGKKIAMDRSYTIGDRGSDLKLGEALGTKEWFLVRSGLGTQTEADLLKQGVAVHARRDLLEIAQEIPAAIM